MRLSFSLVLWLSCSYTSFAKAEETIGADHPCYNVKMACEAAGYKEGAHKSTKKGLHLDCLQPLKRGETVPGVNVSPADLDACKAKKEAHKEHHNNKKK